MADQPTLESRYLEVIIGLLLDLRNPEQARPALRDKISSLSALGLKPIEIVRVLGKEGGSIRSEIAKMNSKRT